MIEVIDSHNKALSAWAKHRSTLIKAPRLITLDHHTDTSRPFRNFIGKHQKKEGLSLTQVEFSEIQSKLLAPMDYSNQLSIEEAIRKLSNDEHIIAAIQSDIISSALVLAHNAENTNLEIYRRHKIICRTVNEFPCEKKGTKPDHDTVLESELLNRSIIEFNKILQTNGEALLLDDNFILDIDLDYFNTFKAIEPQNSKTFKSLAKQAGLITIATEPEYVKSCALDTNLTSEELLKRILQLLSESGHSYKQESCV